VYMEEWLNWVEWEGVRVEVVFCVGCLVGAHMDKIVSFLAN